MATAPDLLKAARETYDLELQAQNGLNDAALEAAISAVLETHERAVLARLAAEAESFAEGMEADPDPDRNPDFAVALRWWAHKMRTDLGPQTGQDYTPTDDDVVEVIITGPVITWGDNTWSVLDDATGIEYEFRDRGRRKARLRVLTRNEQMEDN